mmetsp:Transcript_73290/g.238446  ORF Transcript_73290/g.238446 Transcript_73290/m.238446 type:complete len:219 (+) Transcript_73290:52-708(+)
MLPDLPRGWQMDARSISRTRSWISSTQPMPCCPVVCRTATFHGSTNLKSTCKTHRTTTTTRFGKPIRLTSHTGRRLVAPTPTTTSSAAARPPSPVPSLAPAPAAAPPAAARTRTAAARAPARAAGSGRVARMPVATRLPTTTRHLSRPRGRQGPPKLTMSARRSRIASTSPSAARASSSPTSRRRPQTAGPNRNCGRAHGQRLRRKNSCWTYSGPSRT